LRQFLLCLNISNILSTSGIGRIVAK